MQKFNAPGKIMLTGEYAVLHGATALALPTLKGQHMRVSHDRNGLLWKSFDPNGQWYEGTWNHRGKIINTTDDRVSKKLALLLRTAQQLNSEFQPFAHEVNCTLEFPTNWGLGSSSTVIALVAQWAKVDAMELFMRSWQGSGYDVAVAAAQQPIAYRLSKEGNPIWNVISCAPPDPKEWFFVHQNKKQSTYDEIDRIKKNTFPQAQLDELSILNNAIINAKNNDHYEAALLEHERIISALIQKPRLKDKLNTNLFVKSLGAWGGDFFLTRLRSEADEDKIKQMGYFVIFNWVDFVTC